MEETTCSSCGRQMSLKDLDRRSFREVQGELYCPECFLKMGRPKRMRCPDCGKKTTSVLHDGKYTCTHCGREIGGQQEKGVIASAQPPVEREQPAAVEQPDEQPDTQPEKPPVTVRRKPARRSRAVSVLAVALSCFVAVSLVLGALLIRDFTRGGKRAAPLTQTEEDEEILRRGEQWERDHPGNYDGAIKYYERASKTIQNRALKSKALGIQLHLEGQRDAAVKSDRKANQELTRRLAAAQKQIQTLGKELKKAGSQLQVADAKVKAVTAELQKANAAAAAAKAARTAPARQPPVAPLPGRIANRKSNDSAHAAYLAAMKKAEALIETRLYGQATEALAAVAAKYRGSEWGKTADSERQRILNDAYQEYRVLSERAEILAKDGDDDGARDLYGKALLFGVPEIDDLVRQKVAALEKPGNGPARVPETRGPPAIVKKHIDALRSGNDNERSKAVRTLGGLGSRHAVPHLVDALKDKYWSVRARAAVALGKLGDVKTVPALVDALADEEKAVVFDAHKALKALTKQTFGTDERAKWLEWYRTRGANPPKTPRPEKPEPLKPNSFESSVLMRKYGPDVIRFGAPKRANLKAGMRVSLFRGTDFICRVIVGHTNEKGEVSGGIEGLKPGAKLAPGDKITVQLPK